MHVPVGVGDRLRADELDVVLVVGTDVNHGIGLWPELVSVDVVGFHRDVDGSCVAVVRVEHQGDDPLLALSTAGLRGQVCLAERHAWRVLRGVPSDTVSETAAVPVGRTIDDPICMERHCGAGGEIEVQRRIALHVAQCVGAGARIEFRNIAVDGQIEAVAEGAEAVGVGRHFVLQNVAQQRERRAVGTLRVGSQVYGRNDKAAREIATNAQNRVLNVFRRANQSLEITTVFHVAVAGTRHVA